MLKYYYQLISIMVGSLKLLKFQWKQQPLPIFSLDPSFVAFISYFLNIPLHCNQLNLLDSLYSFIPMASKTEGKGIGIDLGTTYRCCHCLWIRQEGFQEWRKECGYLRPRWWNFWCLPPHHPGSYFPSEGHCWGHSFGRSRFW